MTRRPPSDRRRRPKMDRGAVFVEFALIVPVMMLLAMGIVEYGVGWKWANDVNGAARDAARSATSEPAYLTADRTALVSIGAALSSGQLDAVKKVIIFDADSASGQVPPSCKSMTPASASTGSPRGNSQCNVYGKNQILYALANPGNDGPWVNSSGTGCDGTDIDKFWCPATRRHSLSTDNFDQLGVYIELDKPSTTNFGFGNQTIERTAVFRLEPSFGGA